jgi:hypothetical protein
VDECTGPSTVGPVPKQTCSGGVWAKSDGPSPSPRGHIQGDGSGVVFNAGCRTPGQCNQSNQGGPRGIHRRLLRRPGVAEGAGPGRPTGGLRSKVAPDSGRQTGRPPGPYAPKCRETPDRRVPAPGLGCPFIGEAYHTGRPSSPCTGGLAWAVCSGTVQMFVPTPPQESSVVTRPAGPRLKACPAASRPSPPPPLPQGTGGHPKGQGQPQGEHQPPQQERQVRNNDSHGLPIHFQR